MSEITIKISDDIKDILDDVDKSIYAEALREVAKIKLNQKLDRLEEIRRKIKEYESKYGKKFSEYLQNIPDNIEGHEDWIEWSYLIKLEEQLDRKITRLKILLGK